MNEADPDAGEGSDVDAAEESIDANDEGIDANEGARDAGIADAMTCTETTCTGDVLTVCGASGTVESVETCALGCADNEPRCLSVDPSNGLAAQLEAAAQEDPVTVPAGAVVNTDTGSITAGGSDIPVASTTVSQSSGPAIRVFRASSWTLNNLRLEGSSPVAFVASDDVTILGVVDASAEGNTRGPGAVGCGSNGTGGDQSGGFWARQRAGSADGYGTYLWSTAGAGGGGFGTAGGPGGDHTGIDTDTPGAGGGTNGSPTLSPLRGGCDGGGTGPGYGGAGGGAVQIVSGGAIIVDASSDPAGVHTGGGGGQGADTGQSEIGTGEEDQHGSGGGGSGGAILLEAASVQFQGSALLLAAGGGGGGSGPCTARKGQDAPPNAGTANGGMCPEEDWGQPAIGGAGASASAAQPGTDIDYHAAGSGGGGKGRVRINTADGSYDGEQQVTIRASVTTGTVATQ